MVCSARSTLDAIDISARIQRDMMWTEYSTAKPALRMKLISENAVSAVQMQASVRARNPKLSTLFYETTQKNVRISKKRLS